MSCTRRLGSACPLVLALVLAIAGLTGCGGGTGGGATTSGGETGSPAAGRGGQLVWGKPLEVLGLDPTSDPNGSSWELLQLVYDTLVGVDDDLKPTPRLATSWKQTSPATYVFTIRQGVRFSNGREMTVDDVVGSLERLADPETGSFWTAQLGQVRSIAKAGPWRVKVTLKQPRRSFVPSLAHVMAAVLPMKELRSGTFDPKKELLGTGAFKVLDHKQDESWTLVRNPHYWVEGEPKVDRLVVQIMPEDAARVAALRDGSIDVTTFGTPDAPRLLQGQPNVKAVVQNATAFYIMRVNALTGIFRDDRLREALSLAVDREAIRTVALAGQGRASAAVAPGFQGGCDASAVPFAKPDLARARQLVDAAGARGKRVTIMLSNNDKTYAAIAQVVERNLATTGLDVKIEQRDVGAVAKAVTAQTGTSDFDLAISWVAGYADPAMVLNLWNPKRSFGAAWLRPDSQLDRLVDASFREPPGPELDQLLARVCSRIAQDAYQVPLVTRASTIAYRSDRIVAPVRSLEPFAIPLRNLAEFAVKP
jgi:peptide/nickel transport system substrate-binding protein